MKYNLYNAEPVIQTYSGRYINVFEPDPEDIDIGDIAHALSFVCRWGGHIPVFHSVATHSIHCCQLAPDEIKLQMLLHDGGEAYIGDLASPIKKRMFDYQEVENKLMGVIANKFGFEWPMSKEAHTIDKQVLEMEWQRLKCKNMDVHLPWFEHPKSEFLKTFKQLTK